MPYSVSHLNYDEIFEPLALDIQELQRSPTLISLEDVHFCFAADYSQQTYQMRVLVVNLDGTLETMEKGKYAKKLFKRAITRLVAAVNKAGLTDVELTEREAEALRKKYRRLLKEDRPSDHLPSATQ